MYQVGHLIHPDMSNLLTLGCDIAILKVHTWEPHNWVSKINKSQKPRDVLSVFTILCWASFSFSWPYADCGLPGPTGWHIKGLWKVFFVWGVAFSLVGQWSSLWIKEMQYLDWLDLEQALVPGPVVMVEAMQCLARSQLGHALILGARRNQQFPVNHKDEVGFCEMRAEYLSRETGQTNLSFTQSCCFYWE